MGAVGSAEVVIESAIAVFRAVPGWAIVAASEEAPVASAAWARARAAVAELPVWAPRGVALAEAAVVAAVAVAAVVGGGSEL